MAHQPLPLRLTVRQRSVLRLVCDGLSNREIGQKLRITEGTVKEYVSRIHGEMHSKNRAQLLRTALVNGLYALPGYTLQPIPWQETVR